MNNQNPNQIFEILSSFGKIPKDLLGSAVSFFLSNSRNKTLGYLTNIANQVHELRPHMMALTDEELQNHTTVLKSKLANNQTLEDIQVEAFATIREAARRVLNEEPYLVQIMGGAALHKGMIAEMQTGEGKTLVAILPAYLNALLGLGVHIVTVNDYLAKRDAEWMGQVFAFLGLTTGYVISSMGQNMKKAAYQTDITYFTNNELGFDYLRDNMVEDKSQKVQRDLYYAIVDEADSVLIDEAKTPLIISGPTNTQSEGYLLADSIVANLKPEHYKISLKEHQANFTDEGIDYVASLLRDAQLLGENEELYSGEHAVLLHQLAQALKAHHLYRLGIDYIIDSEADGFEGRRPAVKIIDEHTGRTLHGRRYSDGLHQALEAKEGVKIRSESETLASITFQRLFKMYHKLAGMTGTAMTESEEFEKTYGLKCIDIPTNVPKQRLDYDDLFYITKFQKYKAIIDLINERHKVGQPIIVGTTSVESSEEVASFLEKAGFTFDVLNAKNNEREAEIIANAGRYGSITVVTNIAGRGTDIKLGGDIKVLLKYRTRGLEDEEEIARIEEEIRKEVVANKKKVLEAGGLFVIGVEHNTNRRIDNQLRGRSGRQGDPGASRFFMSTDDELIQKFNPNMAIMLRQFGAEDEEVLEHPWFTNAISDAQKRMEAHNFEIRQALQKYSEIKESYILEFYQKRWDILDRDPVKTLQNALAQVLKSNTLTNKLIALLEKDKRKNLQDVNLIQAEFKAKLEQILAQYPDEAPAEIRSLLLNTLDLNCRRYMDIMTHAKEVVSFQSYTQKDPLISFYNIATDKFNDLMNNFYVESVMTFLTEFDARPNDYSDSVDLEDLTDIPAELIESIEQLKDYMNMVQQQKVIKEYMNNAALYTEQGSASLDVSDESENDDIKRNEDYNKEDESVT